jgi:beta-N-acetylhexosaminidase
MTWSPSSGAVERAAHGVLLASFQGQVVSDWLRARVDQGLGGVCLYGSNRLDVDGTARAAADLRDACTGVLVAADEEGGDVTRLWAGTGSPVPGNLALGAVDDPALTAEVATALGATLLASGVDLVLAPVADVNVDPRNPAIGVRSFGDDATLVARHVASAVEGFQAAGVAACAKHFPGHGATHADSHLSLPVVDADLATLEARELVPFRAAIDAGVAAVMTAHLVVPALDAAPATYSAEILDRLLRSQLGFGGAVVTDALDMGGAGGADRIPGSVVRALAAGVDLCCLGPDGTEELVEACVLAITGAVANGVLPEERLLDAAARVAGIRRPHTHQPADGGAELAELGLLAARRALRIEGDLTGPLRRAHIVELDRPAMVAAGAVPWGIGARVTAADPDTTVARLDPEQIEPARIEQLLAPAAGRPLVVVVRDPARSPAQSALVAGLLAARPDAVVVDMGWPEPQARGGRARIVTHGASAASAQAVAELIAEADHRAETVRVERAAGG